MKKEINYQLWIRRSALFIVDIICITLSCFFALATRFEFIVYNIPEEHWKEFGKYLPAFIVITLIIFSIFRLYTSMWEYAGIQEVYNIVWACIVSGIFQLGIVVVTKGFLPRSYYILSIMYLLVFTCATRFSYRLIRMKRQRRNLPWKTKRNVMLIGAGEGAMTLLTEMQTSRHLERNVRCIIDDDPEKIGRHLRGIRIVGDRYTIKENVYKYKIQQIIICIPSASTTQLRPILDICKETDCELKIMPAIYQLINGEVNVSKLRPVSVNDLLGREEVRVDLDEIMGYVSGKVIMVTGGGGSIGSELCRQIAQHHPKTLVIFDIYENNAYEIQQELIRNHPELDLRTLIGSVRDANRLNAVFEKYRPEIVYHAAAHKHVPLMEKSPN